MVYLQVSQVAGVGLDPLEDPENQAATGDQAPSGDQVSLAEAGDPPLVRAAGRPEVVDGLLGCPADHRGAEGGNRGGPYHAEAYPAGERDREAGHDPQPPHLEEAVRGLLGVLWHPEAAHGQAVGRGPYLHRLAHPQRRQAPPREAVAFCL